METRNSARRGSPIRGAALAALTASGLANLCRPLTRNVAIVFMLHRFMLAQRWADRHESETVRMLLGYLRREKYQLVDLRTLVTRLRSDGPPLHHAVAFTIDDGYADQASIAAPLFAEFDCPVTIFVTTGFLDRQLWMWWDQIEYAFAHAARRGFTFDWGGVPVKYEFGNGASTWEAVTDFTERCKAVPEERKLETIARLAAIAEVDLPKTAPGGYAPMTWDQVRTCERSGARFAPHTVTHPILSIIGKDQARDEIINSWNRIRAETANPVPIFAYPNGRAGDFGEREFDVLRGAGLEGAVTSVPGFATARRTTEPNGEFVVPRFPFPGSLPQLVQHVSGLGRLQQIIRGQALGESVRRAFPGRARRPAPL